MQVDIHGRNIALDEKLREHVNRRLAFALGRFNGRIGNVSVRFADLNGPRGGVDTRCQLTARLLPSGRMMVEAIEDEPFAAVSAAAERMGRAVRRELDRRGHSARQGDHAGRAGRH